jgi:integrase
MAKNTRNANGMGTITKKKDNRYEWKQRKDGETRVVTGTNYNELQEKIKKIAPLQITKSKLKVSEWFETWLQVYIKPLKKQGTYLQYNYIYEQYIKESIGKRKMTTIIKYDIQSIISSMSQKVVKEAVKNKEGKIIEPEVIGLSTWTMKHARKVMNIAFQRAFDEKIINENPVNKIEVPNKQAKTRKTLSTTELGMLFKQLKDSRWIWSLRFLLVTGLRRGELLALKWSNIDFVNRKIIIEESNSSFGLGNTKSSKVHYVPLSGNAIYYLNQQKEMLIKEFNPILHNDNLKKSDLIFPNQSGQMIRADSFYNVIKRAADKINIKASPHMFRHTFVYMSKGLLSLKELQEALGHDESTTTLDIYGTMLSDTHKVANKIDEAFKELDNEINKIEVQKDCKVIPFKKRISY